MKALAILSQDKTLYDLCCKIDEQEKFAQRKLDALKQQAEKIQEEYNEQTDSIWEEIETYLKEKGLVGKDFKADQENIGFSFSKDIVYRGEPESPPVPPEIMEHLFKK